MLLIKADTTILSSFIWHSSHLRSVLWSVQEAASVIPVTEWVVLLEYKKSTNGVARAEL